MFDEPATTNTGMDTVAEEITDHVPTMGLGHNPSLITPNPAPSPSVSTATAADPPVAVTPPVIPPADTTSATPSDLERIQKEAIEKLMPLVHTLDQAPDERFKTLMMVIQASDDQSLIKEAYEAATAITDEKDRAQALLSVVNEINYFASKNSAQ